MRWIPLLLLAAGLVVGLVVPFAWASRAPLLLGAALIATAGGRASSACRDGDRPATAR
jgi:hypothetical protein